MRDFRTGDDPSQNAAHGRHMNGTSPPATALLLKSSRNPIFYFQGTIAVISCSK